MPKDLSEFLGVKVTPELMGRLDRYAKRAKGEDRSDIVRRAIEELLNREDRR